MGYRERGIATGLASGMLKGMKAMETVRLTRQEQARKDEQWKTEKKISELQMKKLENELSPEMLAMTREKHKLAFGKLKSDSELANYKLREAETDLLRKNKMQEFMYKNFMSRYQDDPDFLSRGYDYAVNDEGEIELKPKTGSKGGLTAYQNRTIGIEKNKVLQAIKTGTVYDPKSAIGGTLQMESLDDIMAYASSQNVDMSDPDIQNALQNSPKFGSAYQSVAGGGDTVVMEAPDGSRANVPRERVKEFKDKGAKIVG